LQIFNVNEMKALKQVGKPLSEAVIYEAMKVEDGPESIQTPSGQAIILPGDYVVTNTTTGEKFGLHHDDVENSGYWEPL